jgi:hypothetical protein
VDKVAGTVIEQPVVLYGRWIGGESDAEVLTAEVYGWVGELVSLGR